MILFSIILFLTSIHHVRMQPATCIDDSHCSVGFFCHTITHSCHECLSCEYFGRRPALMENVCIKSGEQCGPCLQGSIYDERAYGAMCLSPDVRHFKMLFSCILLTCIAVAVFLSLFIIHGIWNTPIINVKIAMSPCQKSSSQPSDLYAMITIKDPIGLIA